MRVGFEVWHQNIEKGCLIWYNSIYGALRLGGVVMLLKKVRVTNYKCILDSNEFTVDQLTCLVGKNESGKSAVLQALYKLNPVDDKEQYNSLYEYPKMYLADYEAGEIVNGSTVVASFWKFTEMDIQSIVKEYGEDFYNNSSDVEITRGYDFGITWNTSFNFEALFRQKMEDYNFTPTDNEMFTDPSSASAIQNSISSIKSPSQNMTLFIQWFKASFPKGDVSSFYEKEFNKYLPKFMYFSEYQKMPGRISLNDFKTKVANGRLSPNEKVFEALLVLAGTRIEEMDNSTKLEDIINRTRGVSSKITREIFAYWSQNKHLRVDCRYDMAKPGDEPPYNQGFIFSTRIENTRHDSTVSFDERSAGFVWFFSFLIWFSRIRRDHSNIIVLLDEPGLTLHAKAQSDLLRYVKEKILNSFQVLYTTHSPFMVDFSDILSIRTVEDVVGASGDVLGTKISSDILSTDKDTIFPLQAAFGYDITQTLFVGKNTLLVEGPADILYLTFFSNILSKSKRVSLDKRWTICPSGGIDKIQSFVSLFIGNSLNVASFTDYHIGDKRKIEKLKDAGILKTGHILLASDYTGFPSSDIEDLIGTAEYIYLVNKCYRLNEKNSIKKSSCIEGEVLQYVVNEMSVVTSDIPEFNHYAPSEYLLQNPQIYEGVDLTETLCRFERLFKDLNSLL